MSGLLATLPGVSRVRLPPASPHCCDSTAAVVSHPRSNTQRLMAHGDDVEGVHDGDRVETVSVAAVLKPVNPSIATTSIPSRNAGVWASSQVLNTALERPSTMSSEQGYIAGGSYTGLGTAGHTK